VISGCRLAVTCGGLAFSVGVNRNSWYSERRTRALFDCSGPGFVAEIEVNLHPTLFGV